MSHDLCDLGASTLDNDTNVPLFQCKGPALSNDGDSADYGNAPVMSCLGVSSRPWPSDENGQAQAVVARDIPGVDGVVVGARDTRYSDVYGSLSEGDTAIHGTGPEHKSTVLCKEKQVAIVIEDKDGKNVVVNVDGKNQKVTIMGFGSAIELSKENGISMHSDGAGIDIKDGQVTITGSISLSRQGIWQLVGVPAGSPTPPAAAPIVPIPGITA